MEVEQIADSRLWGQVLAGESSAYAELYRRHTDRVFTHCFRRTANRADAEDLTAEVWRQRDRVQMEEGSELLPWLLGTANNLLRRRHRDHTQASRLTGRLSIDCQSGDHADDVAADLDDLRDLRQLERDRPAGSA